MCVIGGPRLNGHIRCLRRIFDFFSENFPKLPPGIIIEKFIINHSLLNHVTAFPKLNSLQQRSLLSDNGYDYVDIKLNIPEINFLD